MTSSLPPPPSSSAASKAYLAATWRSQSWNWTVAGAASRCGGEREGFAEGGGEGHVSKRRANMVVVSTLN